MSSEKHKTVRIQLTLSSEWLDRIDVAVENHAYGANTRQGVLRALLAKPIEGLKKRK